MTESYDEKVANIKAKIAVATEDAIREYAGYAKEFNPELTDKEANEKGIKLFTEMNNAHDTSDKLKLALELCKTQEDIDDWRKHNKI